MEESTNEKPLGEKKPPTSGRGGKVGLGQKNPKPTSEEQKEKHDFLATALRD